VDYYYGTLLTNTSELYLFGLEKYYDGMLLRIPSLKNPDQLGEITRQDKMFDIFKEHHRWQEILGIRTVGDFNQAIDAGHATDIINISEALQEKKLAKIAEEIASRKGVKLVLLAGPSSSGKTTSCKRLSIQLAVNGLKPLQISLDDYFVDRDKTPKDENGDFDFLIDEETNMQKDRFKEELQSNLNLETTFMEEIASIMKSSNFDIMFITGVGEVFPYIRSHNILNNLQKVARENPTVMFYPGDYKHSLEKGTSLELFELLRDDKYYRAFNIYHYEI
jgi:uridine kinase